jgi:6-phosphofructokinase 1
VIIAEGAHDENLGRISPNKIKDLLTDRLKLDTRVTILGHTQRGGRASAYDRLLGTLQGVEAVNAVLDAKPDTPTPVISVIENKIVRQPLMEAVKMTHAVAAAIEAKDFEKAMAMRDREFKEYLNSYLITTSTDQPDLLLPPEKVSLPVIAPYLC